MLSRCASIKAGIFSSAAQNDTWGDNCLRENSGVSAFWHFNYDVGTTHHVGITYTRNLMHKFPSRVLWSCRDDCDQGIPHKPRDIQKLLLICRVKMSTSGNRAGAAASTLQIAVVYKQIWAVFAQIWDQSPQKNNEASRFCKSQFFWNQNETLNL